jgi:carboxypeptidase Taq
MGADPSLTRTSLTTDLLNLDAMSGASFGTHESQSRLWENQVGRSRSFWQRHFGDLRTAFPEQLADVDAEEFYRAVNLVTPSLIRVEADEVTYNLHIMLRAETEMALVDGTLPVADVPAFWNEKMREYLDLTPPTDTDGALQDVHWSTGYIGSFPTYTIGNVMSAQFLQASRRDLPDLDAQLAAGDYGTLLTWLVDNVYRHARAFKPGELLERATGADLNTGPYLSYLEDKYTDLYAL